MDGIDNLINKRYGLLTVLEKSEKMAKSGSVFICKCDCGKIVNVARNNLVTGHTRSCGCIQKNLVRVNKPSKKHGFSRCEENHKCERLYRVWLGMRQRCNNPNNSHFNIYGGRGIYICADWNDYKIFRKWALENGYNKDAPRGECTIDRINNDSPYSPQNCRFVNSHEQRVNQRRCANE